MSKILPLLALAAVATESFAQGKPDSCADVLVPSTAVLNSDKRVLYSFLNRIDNNSFTSIKSGKSLGGTIPIKGIPINGYANFSDFKDARASYFQETSEAFSYDESISILTQRVEPEAYSAYIQCKESQARATPGMHMWPSSIGKDDVVIKILWMKPPKFEDTISTSFTSTGFESQEGLPNSMTHGQTYTALLRRKPGVDQRLIVNAGPYSDDLLVKYVAPVASVPPVLPPPLCDSKVAAPVIGLGHIAGVGDRSFGEGDWIGSKGNSSALEGFTLSFSDSFPNPVPGLSITYMCHMEGRGDSSWKSAGEFCGTRGASLQLEGFAVKLDGPSARFFTVETYCHIEGSGDMGPYGDGQYCGTKGGGLRMEAIKVKIQSKGQCST